MKVLINILVLFLIGISSISAQNTCGTVQDEAFMQRLIKNKAYWNETINKGFDTRYVPITFHMVARSDGTGRIGEETIYRTMCLLNQRYETAGVDMYFYIEGLNEINNTGVWQDPFNNGGLMRSFKSSNSLNIFVVDDIRREDGSGGTTLGYYTGGGDYVVMRKTAMGDASYTIEHELGHFFTLAHTHRGWEDEGWDPNIYPQKIEFLEIGSSQTQPVLVELVDGSNCEFAADFICDTPADYGRGFTCNCCVLNDIILDRNCDTLAPMMNNIMSYSGGCDTWEFSPDQIVAIQTSYDAPDRTYLRQGNVDTYTPVADGITYIHPMNAEKVDVYDNVKLEWEAVPNAEFYTVIINSVEHTTTNNYFNVTTLTPNKSFNFWGVKAFNKFGGGCAEFQEIYFDVGDQETSAVSELDYVESVNVFPNPVQATASFNVSLSSAKAFKGDVIIYDLAGKTVYQIQNLNFINGANSHLVPAGNLSSGIHILEVRTTEGSITEKLIIE